MFLLLLTTAGATAQTNEFRAWFANGWQKNFNAPDNTSNFIANARAGNFNAIIPQVRVRGDAYYQSRYEPWNTLVVPDYDPLADLVAQAHDTNAGPYLEVYAWMVTFHVWKGYAKPAATNHVVNLHPDWLLLDNTGTDFTGGEYTLDPGHPEVQKHTFNVCMDIITNYMVDGLNFDYIRYSSTSEGYNPVTVARFNRLFGRTGQPSPGNSAWKQFRRDQVTGLLRKVYLNAIAVRPEVKITCDTITWSPGPADDAAWYSSSAAWNSVLQDWRGWMEEGIMDLNLPMAYFDQGGRFTPAWTNWCNFTRDHRFNRHAAINVGTYMNNAANAFLQLRHARLPSPDGNYVDGLCSYDYGTPPSGVNRSNYIYALVNPSRYDNTTPPVFAQRASVPAMPWKVAPTKGHLKGVVYSSVYTNALDGAVVSLAGSVNRSQTNDATGFYGFVDLPPGSYEVTASFPGYPAQTNTATISAGQVTTLDFSIGLPPSITRQPQDQAAFAGTSVSLTAGIAGSTPMACQWRFNGDALSGATQSALVLPSVQRTNIGAYSIVVTNVYGSATSLNAQLSVVLLGGWGDNSANQLDVPAAATSVVAVASGAWHNLALRKDGTVVAWGDNWAGQGSVPAGLTNVLAVAAGGYHNLAILANGTVVAWGANDFGQTHVPAGLANVIAVSAGARHSLALCANGTVVAWGDNAWGQCRVPATLQAAVGIAAGGHHSLALRADGTVVAWGGNLNANGGYSGQSVVPWGLATVAAISAGDYHSLALKADGTVVAWGDNSEGQCDVPPGLGNVVAVVGGGAHSVALKADGSAAGWGANWDHQCELAAGLNSAVALGAGLYHSIALVADSLPSSQLWHPSWQSNRFQVLAQTLNRMNYALECKPSLAATNWTPVCTNAGNGALKVLADPAAAGAQRFYRVRQWPF